MFSRSGPGCGASVSDSTKLPEPTRVPLRGSFKGSCKGSFKGFLQLRVLEESNKGSGFGVYGTMCPHAVYFGLQVPLSEPFEGLLFLLIVWVHQSPKVG